jgi:hypothetical protein
MKDKFICNIFVCSHRIRTIYEDQENTMSCISGSKRKTRETATLTPTPPFYKQFLIKEIKPLKKKRRTQINWWKNNLDNDISKDALDPIFNATKGIPSHAQLIGRRIEATKRRHNQKIVISQ